MFASERPLRSFSGGERVKLQLAILAAEEPELYLLDEPENSLSAKLQEELAKFIEDSARFYGCQFIISTHSPFLLALKGARIYDLDAVPARVRRWSELENVRVYRDFFEKHRDAFKA